MPKTSPPPTRPHPAENELLQHSQRLLTWNAYQEALKDVDQKALQQFQLTAASLRAALWMRVGIYLLQLTVVSVTLFIGLKEVLRASDENYVGLGITGVSFVLFMFLLFRNPVLSLPRTLVDLARIQIILQGFTRQLNQVDSVFKQDFLEKKVTSRTVAGSLAQVQKVVDGNIESLLQFLEELHL